VLYAQAFIAFPINVLSDKFWWRFNMGMCKKSIYKVIFVLLLIILPHSVEAAADTYYVTEKGAGLKNGLSVENAWSIDDFNNSARWSQTDNPSLVDPGDTIYLSGTFTKSFIPRGSGMENSPIIIDGRNAQILTNVNEFPRIFDIKNVQHLALQNLTINGQDTTMSSPGGDEACAIRIREFGAPTGHITIQDSSIQASASGVILQGDVSHIYIYRNTFSNMSNNGVSVVADNYDGDNNNNYDDCPSYIVIGGSLNSGNTFVNIGKLNSEEWVDYEAGYKGGAVPGYTVGTLATDLIFSYNHVYANMTDVGSGIYMNGAKRTVVEYNSIHGLKAENHRSYITFKNDNWFFSEDIIIRFNKISDIYDGPNQYAPPGDAIRISGEGKNRVIYGNYCEGAGINLNWNWTADNDGIGGSGYYLWANIINGTTKGGGISINGTSLNKDLFTNFYIYNNTIYRAVQNYDSGNYFYGINTSFDGTATILQNMNIKNNIIMDSRPAGDKYINISMSYLSGMTIGYNHHHFSGQTPLVYFAGTACAPCAWNSPNLPIDYGANDTAGEPNFNNPTNGDFTLLPGSPCTDSGDNLTTDNSVLPVIAIQGNQYTFRFSEVLAPSNTNWSVTPPIVATADQNSYGFWEKGAYLSVIKKLTPPDNLKIQDNL
jgi:hypothetical protein